MDGPITLEQALERGRNEFSALFRKHVNPIEGDLLKMARLDKRYVRAEGINLYDEEGNRYLDFTAGYGALNLGHNPPEVLEAVRRARELPSVMLMGINPLAGAAAASLAAILPGDLTVASFGSGGAEAVELAMKTARAATGRTGIIGCEKSYHGQSFGAVSASGSLRQRDIVGPLLPDCLTVPFGDLEALDRLLRDKTAAAFIVEPVQGEGGARVPPAGYLKGAEQLCRLHGTLFVLDEIQTGFGRTGKLFAAEHDDLLPDIMILSKSLGAGVVPISASVTRRDIWDRAFGKRDRFDMVISTFGGHSAACAAALKSIEIILRDDLPARAEEMGRYARERLEALAGKHKRIAGIRGRGLMLGVVLVPPHLPKVPMEDDFSAMVISRLLNGHGVLTGYCDLDSTVLRFEPPLTVTREEIDQAVDALDAVMSKGIAGIALSFGASLLK